MTQAFMIPDIVHFNAKAAKSNRVLCGDECHTQCTHDNPKAGWYGRLSAPGYLDCTEWMGPYATHEEALREVCEWHEVDEDGNDTDAALDDEEVSDDRV